MYIPPLRFKLLCSVKGRAEKKITQSEQAQVTTMRWLGKFPQSLSINAVEVNIHGPQHSL